MIVENNSNSKNIFYPPGGILIWFIIILEIFTFLGAVGVFLHYRKLSIAEFEKSQQLLSSMLGTINTLFLITSGYLVANAVQCVNNNQITKAILNLRFGLALGLLFLIIKAFEFFLKINLGIGFTYNTYFTFYWLMTGFHFVHVLFGIGLLFYNLHVVRKEKMTVANKYNLETTAVYWHMCDLIWVLIFPVLYLL